jgi:proteasome assembly chaperone (PAC2) family protein
MKFIETKIIIPSNHLLMQFIEEQTTTFENKLILVGIPSIGNVGQLSIDLLINSLQAKRVGYFYTKFVLPVVGNSPFSEEKNDLHTRVEGKTQKNS